MCLFEQTQLDLRQEPLIWHSVLFFFLLFSSWFKKGGTVSILCENRIKHANEELNWSNVTVVARLLWFSIQSCTQNWSYPTVQSCSWGVRNHFDYLHETLHTCTCWPGSGQIGFVAKAPHLTMPRQRTLVYGGKLLFSNATAKIPKAISQKRHDGFSFLNDGNLDKCLSKKESRLATPALWLSSPHWAKCMTNSYRLRSPSK